MFPFAHAGHVLIDLPIFLGPVIAIGIWLKLAGWREKRDAKRKHRSERQDPPMGSTRDLTRDGRG
jgi:hypothetical protein